MPAVYEMSIEVLDGEYPASFWKEAWSDSLIQAAIRHGAVDWRVQELRWGVVLEFGFTSQEQWELFRVDPTVEAALDAVPNSDSGLLIYRGWGGSSWPREPRRPRPMAGAGAAALPLPDDDYLVTEAPRRVLLLAR